MSRVLLLSLITFVACLPFAILSPSLAQSTKGKKYALLVGVNDCKHPDLPVLRFTENDVEELALVLKSPASKFDMVRVLTVTRGEKDAAEMPTAENILKALANILDQVTSDDTVLIALSGHGVQLEVDDPDEEGKPRKHPFFCPYRSDFRKVSYSKGTAPRLVNLNLLLDEVKQSAAGAKLVLVDACRNFRKADSSTRDANQESVSVPPGVGVLFSCKSGQQAWESEKFGKGHGAFFYHVLEGLRGAPEARNSRGQVTWDRLAAYVKEEVPAAVKEKLSGAEQTPHGIVNIVGVTVLARVDVKKGDPRPPTTPVEKGEWGKEITSSYTKMKLVRVIGKGEKATFQMGSPASEKDREPFDKGSELQHEVELTRPYWLGKNEVTQGEFKRVMGYNPSYFSRDGEGKAGVDYGSYKPAGGKEKIPAGDDPDSYPVENVSWEEAKEFCEKLTKLEAGRVYRLPSEAEWEYACRGPAGEYKTFHFGNTLNSTQANFNGNYPYGGAKKGPYLERTSKVGYFSANGFGLYDMHGNVCEWCADWYNGSYYAKTPRTNPENTDKASFRVIRGGSWCSLGQLCRSAYRNGFVPSNRGDSLGFRLAAVPSR